MQTFVQGFEWHWRNPGSCRTSKRIQITEEHNAHQCRYSEDKQVEIRQGLPFTAGLPQTPNKESLEALEEALDRKNLASSESTEALLEDMGI